jgi:hypothetical protein
MNWKLTYRKPTTTDTTINFLSNHPIEHRMAAYRYYIDRMHTLPLDENKKRKEWQTIQRMGKSNNVPTQLLQKLNKRIQQKTRRPADQRENETWTIFTYHSPKIRAVTNLFKSTNIKIAFKTADTTQKIIRPRKHPASEYEKSSIYKITCKTCSKTYVGQTSRNLRARHKEHTRYIKNNDPRSAYARDILNNRYEYGNIEDTMTLLKGIDKQTLLLSTEQLYIQTLHNDKKLIPEQIPMNQIPYLN